MNNEATLHADTGVRAATVPVGNGLDAVFGASFLKSCEAEKQHLLRRGRSAPDALVDSARMGDLPVPVRRFLELTHTPGRPAIKVAVVKQRGRIRMAPDKPWMPFESEQAYSMQPPGFVWLARARMAPLANIMARDRFVDSRGNLLVRLLGMFTVANASGPEIDQGAAMRYWSEVISFPEAVLDAHLDWEPIDDRHARLNVELDARNLSALVGFDPDGYPCVTHANRYRDLGGKRVLTPWSGYSRSWKVIDGRMFPSQWESVWHLPEGPFLAVQIEILGIETE